MRLKLTVVGILLIILLGIYFIPPWAKWERNFKHYVSGNRGLNRTVEQLNCNGDVLKTWTGRFTMEVTQSGISFTDDDGRDIKIGGFYRVIEQ